MRAERNRAAARWLERNSPGRVPSRLRAPVRQRVDERGGPSAGETASAAVSALIRTTAKTNRHRRYGSDPSHPGAGTSFPTPPLDRVRLPYVIDASEPAPDRPRGPAVVVVGASAGGVEALVALAGSLPQDFPHPMLVVLHISPAGTSVLPAILSRACRLQVSSAADGEPLRPGHVYVAPPDSHLLVEDAHVRLSQAPRENGHRPAIDPTMRTAAAAYDGATIGIVLSGSRDDGTAGLIAIKARGGTAIVQEPDEALYPAMPRSAIAHLEPDAVLPIAQMARWIMNHGSNSDPPGGEHGMTLEDNTDDPRLAIADTGNEAPHSAAGRGTRFTCPDCGGVLFERHEGNLERFECSVGHVFSIESLSNAQAEALENALWAAVRSLEDRAAMLKRLAGRASVGHHRRSATTFERQAEEALDRARTIRDAIERTADDAALVAES
jgi:two-component system chemotaxis response regulator CheB